MKLGGQRYLWFAMMCIREENLKQLEANIKLSAYQLRIDRNKYAIQETLNV